MNALSAEWRQIPAATFQNIFEKASQKKNKKRKDGRLIPIVLGSDAAPVTWMHTEESSGGESDGAQIQIWEMALCYGVIAEMA